MAVGLLNTPHGVLTSLSPTPPPPETGGVMPYETAFTNTNVVTILGSVHLFTSIADVVCWDAATPSAKFEPSLVTVDPATHTVIVYLGSSQSGTIFVIPG